MICLLYFSTAVLLMFGILSLLQVHIVSDILQLSEGIFILVGTGNLFMPAKLNRVFSSPMELAKGVRFMDIM